MNKNDDEVIPLKSSPRGLEARKLSISPAFITANPKVSPRVSPSPEDKKVEAPVTENAADGEVDAFMDDEESDYEEETVFEKNSRLRAKKSRFLGFMYNTATNPFYNMMVFALILGNTITLTIDDFP